MIVFINGNNPRSLIWQTHIYRIPLGHQNDNDTCRGASWKRFQKSMISFIFMIIISQSGSIFKTNNKNNDFYKINGFWFWDRHTEYVSGSMMFGSSHLSLTFNSGAIKRLKGSFKTYCIISNRWLVLIGTDKKKLIAPYTYINKFGFASIFSLWDA